jgi:ABC-type transporter Mla subunit MlaD
MSPDELARLWRHEHLSVEQAIGHITQNLVQLQEALDAHRHVLHESLEQQKAFLTTLNAALPEIHALKQAPRTKKSRSSK